MEITLNKNFWKRGMVIGAGVLVSQLAWTPNAHAQPDPNDAAKAVNPPENNRLPRQNAYNRGGNPAEMQQRMEAGMRQMLTQAGVNDAPTQDIVLAYVKVDTDARSPMRMQSMKLWQAVRGGGVTDDQLLALVTDYRASQQAEKVRREKAEADLEAKIHFSKNPRLEALLLLSGMIGDGGNPMMMGGGRGMGGGGRGPNAGGAAGMNGQLGQPGGPQNIGDMRKKMQEKFDKNGDGTLDADEKAAFEQWRAERRKERENQQQDQPPAPGGNPNGNNDNPPPPPPPNIMPDA